MALTRTLILESRDILKWHYTREHWRAVNRIEVRGFVAGRDTTLNLPLFSEWVGLAPGEGNATGTVERKIIHDYGSAAANQAGLNARAGRLGAAQDGIYVDADGALQMALDLELTMRAVYDVFDLYDEVLELDVTTNKRGIDFSEHLFVFISSSVDLAANTTTLRFRTCTNGTAGHTYIPPTTPSDPGDVVDPPPLPPPPPGDTGLTRVSDLYIVDYTNAVVWGYSRAAVTWEAVVDLGAEGLSGLPVDATWTIGGNAMRVVTEDEVRVLNNYSSGTPALTTAHSFPETTTNRQMEFERGDPDFGAVITYKSGTGVLVDISTDGGLTWTRATTNAIFAHYDSNGANNPYIGLFVDPHYAGRLVVSVATATASINGAWAFQLWQTLDYGTTWSQLSSPVTNMGSWFANMIVVAFGDSGAATIFHGHTFFSSGTVFFRLYRNSTDVSPEYPPGSGTRYGYVQGARCLDIADDDPNSLILIAAATANVSTVGVFLSRDGGTSWTVLIAPSSDVDVRVVYFVSRNTAYLIGLNGTVLFWDGSRMTDMSIPAGGDLRALMGP